MCTKSRCMTSTTATRKGKPCSFQLDEEEAAEEVAVEEEAAAEAAATAESAEEAAPTTAPN